MKKIVLGIAALLMMFGFGGCSRDAQTASHNLSKQSDMFQIDRRVVFYNGITGEYMLTIQGRCSLEPSARKLAVTCKISEGQFKKHYLGLSDNVTYFAEQLYSKDVSVYHYEVVFKPQSIIPDVDFEGSSSDLLHNRSQ